MTTAAMKRIGQLAQYRFLDVFNGAVLQQSVDQKVIYVDSNTGTDSAVRNGEDIRTPLATIDYAINKCVANQGDTILVLPRHAETVTSSITMDTAGVQIHGLKLGNARPIITPNGAIDAITITAANCMVTGLQFAVPSTDAQTADINIAAAYAHIEDCVHFGSTSGAKNKVAIYTITSAGTDLFMKDIEIYNVSTEVPSGIVFESTSAIAHLENIFVYDTVGFTNGAISDGGAATGIVMKNCVFMNTKAATAVIKFSNSSVGYGINIGINGRHTTIASNVSGAAFNFFGSFVCEEAAKSGMTWAVDAE